MASPIHQPQFLIGIDLGTTHTVVAYSDIGDGIEKSAISIFNIDQLIGPGEVVRKPLLPSFRFHPSNQQVSEQDLTLPWLNHPVEGDLSHVIIGEWARELGSKVEGRQVVSAKSWLSHSGVDRTEDILPWAAANEVERVSPIVASASYLNHLRQSWNYHHPNALIEHQEVVITVPASFDEAARSYTLQAAKLAGLTHTVLLEEPQAVCYDWYHQHQHQAQQQLRDLPLILICDVGGGTTDLSLIKASFSDDKLHLERIGVGDHLMLGGDNLDLALAHLAEQRLSGDHKLKAATLTKLIQQTRKAKERLLSDNAPDVSKITLLGSGSRLIGGSKSVEITKEEVHHIALDGFFPMTPFKQMPNQRRAAVVEFGLPYAADPAISKHLAQFIDTHRLPCSDALELDPLGTHAAIPTAVLLNGGVFNSNLLRQRVLDLFSQWSGSDIVELSNPHPNLAVAYGAVVYAKARHGTQLKIMGGTARSYYLLLEEKSRTRRALCLLSKGTDEGVELRLHGREFDLTLGEPVRFTILSSTHDSISQAGAIHQVNPDDYQALPPYVVTLKSSRSADELHANQKDRVRVSLACQYTEVGTLKLECVSLQDDTLRWDVEFEIRKESAKGDSTIDDDSDQLSPKQQQAIELINTVYGPAKPNLNTSDAVKTLNKDLEKKLGNRNQWDSSSLRQLFSPIISGKKRRRRSELHERNWLKLAGFTLRPGFGFHTDQWRIDQIWPIYQQGIHFKSKQSWNDWWTLWRRVAGGLNQQQQEAILTDVAKYLHPASIRSPKMVKESEERSYEGMVKLSASLEHLDVDDKILLASWFLKRLKKTAFAQAHWWALGRLASRSLFYGHANSVIPPEQVANWMSELLVLNWKQQPIIGFAAVLMCRKTGDRTLDIAQPLRDTVLTKLKASRAPDSWVQLVATRKVLDESETQRLFGEALPAGLQLR